MIYLQGRNVNQVFTDAFWMLRTPSATKELSRNGPVLVANSPVISEYRNPTERVLFNTHRDANHVFHLVEAIWMLAGRDDVEFLLPFNSSYGKYAEPDGRVHGAYGKRWRNHFSVDQILATVHTLKRDPQSRQVVVEMWDAKVDLIADVRDRPCNTHIYFDLRGGSLNMTVCCRSNDALWGAYGANVVHMSMVQELIALALGRPVGVYRQFSNNLHVYTDLPMVKDFLDHPPQVEDLYMKGKVFSFPMLSGNETIEEFLADCELWCFKTSPVATRFINEVVDPLARAYLARKRGESSYLDEIEGMPDDLDWKVGFHQWLRNRSDK